MNNLIPVTLGNIVGGSLFVAGIYWFVYIKNDFKKEHVPLNQSRPSAAK